MNKALEDYVFVSKYSRFIPEKNRRETYDEAVDRVINMHRKHFADKNIEVEDLLEEVSYAMHNKLVLGSQRAMQFGGDPILKKNARLYNCFHKDTEFITTHGVRKFSDYEDGDIITVLTHKGNWKNAVVKNYGKQQLFKLTFVNTKNSKNEYIVKATRNHRWILHDSSETTDIQIKDILYKLPTNEFDLNIKWTLKNIEEDVVDDVWCLEVEDDHSFVMPNGIVTGNCTTTYCDRPRMFQETLWLLLCGAGVGFSVQKHHIEKLPKIQRPRGLSVTYQIQDSIEGWSDALGVLLSSYFVTDQPFKKYYNKIIQFDYSLIRPKGSPISSGTGKAPGPKPLERSLELIRNVLRNRTSLGPTYLRPIDAYDIVMHISDAVLSGGVRRCLPGETLIQTDKNVWTRIDELCLTDKVYIFNQYYNIKNIFRQGFQKLSKINVDFYESGIQKDAYFESTKNHKWYTYNSKENNFGWVMTKDLQPFHGIVTDKNSLNFVTSVEFDIRTALTYDIEIESNDHAFIAMQPDTKVSGVSHNSATICLFSIDDEEMIKAKTGNWFIENPQRARSNNSVMLMRDQITKEQFFEIMKSVKEFGEPGFIWTDNLEATFNPCVTGDTLVETDNGLVQIKDLIGKEGCLIKSFNTVTNRFEFKSLIAAAKTKENAEIIKLTFSNNSVLKCTPDHKIYTIDNGYVEAQNLNIKHRCLDEIGRIIHIVTIELNDNDDVYDITVEDNHNFIANNVLIHNCAEIGLYPQIDGRSGFAFCNLSEINIGKVTTPEEYFNAARAAAILGTLQASYTKFDYLGEVSEKIAEREALLGVSMTGMMENPDIAFNPELQKRAAKIVLDTNEYVAKRIGLNPAARTTAIKPSGCTFWSTKIKTNEGIKTLEEIFILNGYDTHQIERDNINNTWYEVKYPLNIINENGEEESISKLYVNGFDTTFPIKTKDQVVFATEDHKFKINNRWVSVKELFYGKSWVQTNSSFIKPVIKFTVDIETETTHTYQLSDGTISHNTASCILGTSSGIHPHHAKRYFRRAQANIAEAPAEFYKKHNPLAIENSVWNPNGTDIVITFCVEAGKDSIVKNNVTAIELLDKVKLTKQNWIDFGKRLDKCAQPWLSHNVSNTISVKDNEWADVANYIYDNRSDFAGISLLSFSGDQDYAQAPFCKVLTPRELVTKYGTGAILASGLIVDGLIAFNNDLWKACDAVMKKDGVDYEKGLEINSDIHPDIAKTMIEVHIKQQKWIKRVFKFAKNYFKNDVLTTTRCLKSVHNTKLWEDLNRNYIPVDYTQMIEEEDNTSVGDTIACSGSSCEIL